VRSRAPAVFTPTLAETARRRADLYEAILALERAAARPAAGREVVWSTGVIDALEELGREILDHIDVTERPDGLYAEMGDAAPRLLHSIARLRGEHLQMRAQAEELIERFRSTEIGPGWPIEEARDAVQRLLGLLVKHRQRGADLVWQAYSLDIGDTG
jgi:Hemerythrin HHE cation binding domain